jgi:hypothetical protein
VFGADLMLAGLGAGGRRESYERPGWSEEGDTWFQLPVGSPHFGTLASLNTPSKADATVAPVACPLSFI